jgi:glycosyltransferase involved in cell wall biosynthesis
MADRSPESRSRLCHVITTPTDQYSSGLRTRMEAQIALDLGFAVDIITGQGPADRQLISQGVPGVTYWRFPALTKYIYPHRDLKALLDLYLFFRRQRYQIVHTHLAKAGVIGRLAAGLAGVPVIVHDVHGPSFTTAHSWSRRSLFINLERLAGLVTTNYIFYTAHLKESFAAQGISEKANKQVIYPDLRLRAFLEAPPLPTEERDHLRSRWQLAPEHLVIGYAARMVPSKGHHLAIEALPYLLDRWPQVRLLLVGGAIWPEEQAYLRRLHSLVKNLNLEDKVIFTGHQMQMTPFYQVFDLFVLPSLYEGTANAMLEAMCMGLPVVAFNIPAVNEFCPSEVIVCPVGQVKGLAEGLERGITLLTVSPAAVRPSLAFRQDLVDRFSANIWRQKVADFYSNLANGSPRGVGEAGHALGT